MISVRTGFDVQKHGFQFRNHWPQVPLLTLPVGPVNVPIGNASNGLCGGMAFAARDIFEIDGTTRRSTENPPARSATFDYLVARLFDSFNLPNGPLRYLALQNPAMGDADTIFGRGRSYVTIMQEWPKVKDAIDSRKPVTIGLISAKSLNPFDLGKHHQVLAYGYDLDGPNLSIVIYDPNYANEEIRLSFSLDQPSRARTFSYTGQWSIPERRVFAFWVPSYNFKRPPTEALEIAQPVTATPIPVAAGSATLTPLILDTKKPTPIKKDIQRGKVGR